MAKKLTWSKTADLKKPAPEKGGEKAHAAGKKAGHPKIEKYLPCQKRQKKAVKKSLRKKKRPPKIGRQKWPAKSRWASEKVPGQGKTQISTKNPKNKAEHREKVAYEKFPMA